MEKKTTHSKLNKPNPVGSPPETLHSVTRLLKAILCLLIILFPLQLMAQPVLVGNIPDNSDDFIEFKGDLYFAGNNHLWKWANNHLTQLHSVAGPVEDIVSDSKYIYYTVRKDDRETLYRSLGTSATPVRLETFNDVYSLTPFKDNLYFIARTYFYGDEIWRTTGTKASLLKDINSCSLSGIVWSLEASADSIYFVGIDTDHGAELWSTDGTSVGTSLLKDIAPGPESSYPNFVYFNNHIYFTTTTPDYTSYLQKLHNGTIDTLMELSAAHAGVRVLEDRLILTAREYAGSDYLWVSKEQNSDQLTFVGGGYGDDGWISDVEILGDSVFWYVCKPADDGLYFNLTDLNTGQKIPFEHQYYRCFDCIDIIKVKNYLFYPSAYSNLDEISLCDYISQTDLDRSIVLDKLFADNINTQGVQKMFEFENKLIYTRNGPPGSGLKLYYYDPVPIQTTSFAVTRLTLVDTLTNTVVAELHDGDTLGDYSTSLNHWLNTVIVAEVSDSPGSVSFSGNIVNKNPQGTFTYHWTPSGGTRTITAYPFALPDGKGLSGEEVSVSFTIISAESVREVYVVNALTGDTLGTLENNDTLGNPAIPSAYQLFSFRPTINTEVEYVEFYVSDKGYNPDFTYPYQLPDTGGISFAPGEHYLFIYSNIRLSNGAYSYAQSFQARFETLSSDSVTGFHLVNALTRDTLQDLFDYDTVDLGAYPFPIEIVASTNIPNIDHILYTSERYYYVQYKPGDDIITAIPFLQGGGEGKAGRLHITFQNSAVRITGFALVDTLTDQVIRPLVNGDTIGDFNTFLSDYNYDIQVLTEGPVSYVESNGFKDATPPYYISNMINGGLFRYAPGSYSLEVVPHAANNTIGESEIISFFVAAKDSITSFTVVNLDTGEDLFPLTDHDTLDLAAIGTEHIGIRANTNSPAIDAMLFNLYYNPDEEAPFMIGENIQWQNTDYTLLATPRIGNFYNNYLTATIHFTILTNRDLKVAIVNADTEQDIRLLRSKDTLYANGPVNLRADFSFNVESVSFYLNGTLVRTENVPPYALAGDINGDYNTWIKQPGTYELGIVPYTGNNASGIKGCMYTFTVTILPEPPRVRFILVDADANNDIRTLHNNDVIIYNKQSDEITIRAIPSQPAGSVRFYLNGRLQQTESTPPYALKGDRNGDYTPWYADYKKYTLTARVYSGPGGSGTLLETDSITFEVKAPAARTGITTLPVNLVIYPNPVKESFNVMLENQDKEEMNVEILNSEGHVYYQAIHQATNGTLQVDLTGKNMNPGIYFLKLKTGEGTKVFKIAKE